jgi:hypothetical protein
MIPAYWGVYRLSRHAIEKSMYSIRCRVVAIVEYIDSILDTILLELIVSPWP